MKKLGKYEILEQIGTGGFGTVYKAKDTIGRTVALKVLKPGWSEDASVIERFRREAQAAGSLFHPRIATILDFDEANGRLFLVIRYVDGLPLDKLIKEKGRLDWNEAVRILSQVAEGLEYAHAHGFVHRDVKPANILVSEKEGAVLTDFGLVKAAQSSGLSTSGVVLGTPNYIAPEIWEGKEASPATDVYSLACVFFEMVTDTILFDGESTPQIMTKHVLKDPQFPEKWPQEVPEGLSIVLAKALNKEPAQRFAAVKDFYAAIARLETASLPQEKVISDTPPVPKAAHPAPQPEPAQKDVIPDTSPVPVARRSRLALVSLIAGIMSWITLSLSLGILSIGLLFIGLLTIIAFLLPYLLFLVLAIFTGHMAKREIKRSGGKIGGNGMATIGLVLGYAGLVISLFGCFAYVLLELILPALGYQINWY